MNNFDMMYYSRCDYLSNIEETIRVALEEDDIDVYEVEDFVRFNFTDLSEDEIAIVTNNY